MPVSAEQIAVFFAAAPLVPVQELHSEMLQVKQIKLLVKREDILHPEISGNKWRKLKYNLLAAAEGGSETLLTFGGAYSNHLAAVAAAGHKFGFRTIGLVRGEEHFPLNPTLQKATEKGMKLHYLDRETYRKKQDPEFLKKLHQQFGPAFMIPEGGTNREAVKGCTEILTEVIENFDVVTCAAGTGGTVTGLISGLKGHKKILVFPALKGDFLQAEIEKLVMEFSGKTYQNWQLETNYHFGGYAKFNEELLNFIRDFQAEFGIPLEPVYTGKMFYGLFDMISKDAFPPGTTILAIHTGGLQGRAGFEQRFGITL